MVYSEQSVFFKDEQSNKVLMKGSTKTTCQINQSKLMEALMEVFFVARVKFCSWFNLEENFYSKLHFSLSYVPLLSFSLALGLRLLYE